MLQELKITIFLEVINIPSTGSKSRVKQQIVHCLSSFSHLAFPCHLEFTNTCLRNGLGLPTSINQ